MSSFYNSSYDAAHRRGAAFENIMFRSMKFLQETVPTTIGCKDQHKLICISG